MARANTDKITIRLPEEEKQLLQDYCDRKGRTQSDVIREFIRSLAKK